MYRIGHQAAIKAAGRYLRPHIGRSLRSLASHAKTQSATSLDYRISRLLRDKTELSSSPANDRQCSYEAYRARSGTVLDHVLQYEAYPSSGRRAGSGGDEVVLVIHAVEGDEEASHVISSGFVVDATLPGTDEGDRLVVSCAHTLEQIEHRHPGTSKKTYILPPSSSMGLIPVENITTASPRTDLIIGQLPRNPLTDSLRSLPLSPYPIYRGQEVLVHLYGESGSEWGRWINGKMLGYRGHAWEEVEPGTSAALPYILISALPTSGSSGGPIVDATSGAVVGMVSGRRMDNRIEKERGWGSSAESIFEMFSIPGFTPASRRRRQLGQ